MPWLDRPVRFGDTGPGTYQVYMSQFANQLKVPRGCYVLDKGQLGSPTDTGRDSESYGSSIHTTKEAEFLGTAQALTHVLTSATLTYGERELIEELATALTSEDSHSSSASDKHDCTDPLLSNCSATSKLSNYATDTPSDNGFKPSTDELDWTVDLSARAFDGIRITSHEKGILHSLMPEPEGSIRYEALSHDGISSYEGFAISVHDNEDEEKAQDKGFRDFFNIEAASENRLTT
jgi:hypothetical protein